VEHANDVDITTIIEIWGIASSEYEPATRPRCQLPGLSGSSGAILDKD